MYFFKIAVTFLCYKFLKNAIYSVSHSVPVLQYINELSVLSALESLRPSFVLSGTAVNVTLSALLICLHALIKAAFDHRSSIERHYEKC